MAFPRMLLLFVTALAAAIPLATPAGPAKLPTSYRKCGKCGGRAIDKGKSRYWCPRDGCEHFCTEDEKADGTS